MNPILSLSGKTFDLSRQTIIIAEIAQAHDGSLGMAHAYIDAVARTGADAIKFQTHIADEESTPDEPWRVKFSYQDKERIDYWRRMEFTLEQWIGLRDHTIEKGLIFLSSPFSSKAVDWLERCDVPVWKIASGEINNWLLYERLAQTGKPVILSSGMSLQSEIDQSVEFFKTRGLDVSVMQCTTEYPCPPEKIGLSQLGVYKDRYDCPVGLSDHSGTIFPSLAAVALGASLIELHVTFSKEQFGPDVSSSITIDQLQELVQGIRAIERMKDPAYNKEAITSQKTGLRKIFGKSLVAQTDLKPGDPLTLENLAAKKPQNGIPVSELYAVLGRVCQTPVRAGDFIQYEHLGDMK